jgi:hypothetical protein
VPWSRAAGVAPAQRFVAGERDPTLSTASKVAAALGLVLVLVQRR